MKPPANTDERRSVFISVLSVFIGGLVHSLGCDRVPAWRTCFKTSWSCPGLLSGIIKGSIVAGKTHDHASSFQVSAGFHSLGRSVSPAACTRSPRAHRDGKGRPADRRAARTRTL